MAKRKAKAALSRPVPAVFAADATELGASPGVLVIRSGSLTGSPAILTVPAEIVGQFVSKLQEAARAAEEEYWDLLPAFRAGAASDDPAELTRVKEKWLLSQPWHQERRRVLGRKRHPLFFLNYAGHVGVVAERPYMAASHLLIFDPLQLHRLAPAFQQAADRVQQSLSAAVPDPAQRLAAAHREWSAVPWPRSPVLLPTQEQAAEVITGLRREFLRRVPLITD